MSSKVSSLSDATFGQEVGAGSGVVLVDFWAEWCGPCKSLAPVLEDVAEEYSGEARITKINADDNKASSEKYGVRGLPTMILFVDGEERERIVGVATKTRIAAAIDSLLEA